MTDKSIKDVKVTPNEIADEAPHVKRYKGCRFYEFDEVCDTCGETMEEIEDDGRNTMGITYTYWCPECGTILLRWYNSHPIRPDMWKRPIGSGWKGLVAAACQRGVMIRTGVRHCDAIRKMIEAGCESPIRRHEQGFVTERGIFLGKEAAAIYAHEHGQTKELICNLTSEDLW